MKRRREVHRESGQERPVRQNEICLQDAACIASAIGKLFVECDFMQLRLSLDGKPGQKRDINAACVPAFDKNTR